MRHCRLLHLQHQPWRQLSQHRWTPHRSAACAFSSRHNQSLWMCFIRLPLFLCPTTKKIELQGFNASLCICLVCVVRCWTLHVFCPSCNRSLETVAHPSTPSANDHSTACPCPAPRRLWTGRCSQLSWERSPRPPASSSSAQATHHC